MRDGVELKIGDRILILQPNIEAMYALNRAHGSAIEAMRRVQVLDFEVIVSVIAIGAQLKDEARKKMAQDVFDHGMVSVAGPVSEFLAIMIDPAPDEEKGEGKP